MKHVQPFFPILSWGRSYSKSAFKGDLMAGITVGVLLIPQGMAYAMLAGLPPVYGLYAGLLPPIVYAFMGTSRSLAVGPVALDSMLVASGLSAFHFSHIGAYIGAAIFLAFLVGLLQMILGGLRLGFLIRYLSKPVVSGFSSAAALIIGLSQVDAVFGFSIPTTFDIQTLFFQISEVYSSSFTVSFYLGFGAVVFLLLFKRYLPHLPSALILVGVAIPLSFYFGWEGYGVKVVGFIPEGLPEIKIPVASVSQWFSMGPLALTIALIAFMEALSVGKTLEEQNNQSSLRPNQELIALGASNLIGSIFHSYPISGGFSRSAVNHQLGAKTVFSGFISALVVGLVLLFFTEYFYHLPMAVLGAIIIVAVFQLINLSYPKELWQNHRVEFFILCITFFSTLILGIKYGILFGVFSALAYMVYKSSKPHIAVLGRIVGTNHFKNISRFSADVMTYPNVLILRYDGSLFFGNQGDFKQKVGALIRKQNAPVKHVIIDAGPIHYVDATAMHMLHKWILNLKRNQITVLWTHLTGPVRDAFYKCGIVDAEQTTFFSSLDAAVKYLHGEAPNFNDEKISNQVNQ